MADDTPSPNAQRTDSEVLRQIADDLAIIRTRETVYDKPGWSTPPAGPAAAEYREKSLWHLRALSTIAIIWSASSLALGLWVAAMLENAQKSAAEAAEEVSGVDVSGMTYDECMEHPDTLSQQCVGLPGS